MCENLRRMCSRQNNNYADPDKDTHLVHSRDKKASEAVTGRKGESDRHEVHDVGGSLTQIKERPDKGLRCHSSIENSLWSTLTRPKV